MPFVSLPNSGQSLGQTRQQIKDNMDLLRSTIGNNHVDVNDVGAGDHKYCLFASQGSDPTTVAATPPGPIIALYNKSVTGVNNLYIRRPADGTVVQMTAGDPSSPTFAKFVAYGTPPAGFTQEGGWTFLPGGLLYQYGVFSKTNALGTSGTIQFPVAFTSFFSINISLSRSSGNQSITLDQANPPTVSQFSFLTSSSGSSAVYWSAIGLA